MKIEVKNPIVELDGDEMTRIIWQLIKERLILPHLEIALEYYDLGLPNRDRSDDAVTREAAQAIRRVGVGVKCATITPDAGRIAEYKLKRAWPSPNGTIRGILDGTVFRKPILAKNIRPAVRSWSLPIVVGRHAYGDLYSAVDFVVPGPGKAELVFTPRGAGAGATAAAASAAAGQEEIRLPLHEFSGPGVVMGMHNTDASISSFAAACVDYALSEKIELWFAAKDTISKRYHGRFRDLFAAEVEARSAELEAAGVAYRYLLIDDAVARVMKHPGGILWACTNYDGDVFSDMVAAGFGSLGMIELRARVAPRPVRVRGRARHRASPLLRASRGASDEHQSDRLHLRLDGRDPQARRARRYALRGRLRGQAGARHARPGRGGHRHQGPRGPRRTRA